MFNKKYITGKGSRITLTNNKIKDIMKVIKPFKNKGDLFKGTATKITSQEGEFLKFLKPLMAADLPLIKSVLTALAKSVLLIFGLSAAITEIDATIQIINDAIRSAASKGRLDAAPLLASLIILNEQTEDIMKVVKSFEESGLLIKWIIKTINIEAKEQKGEFLPIILVTLAASLLGSGWTGRRVIRVSDETKSEFLMLFHSLTNFKIEKYIKTNKK